MTKTLRHTFLLLAAIALIAACDDRAIPSDTLGTDGITQGKISYDTIAEMRVATGDTLDIAQAIDTCLKTTPSGSTTGKSYYIIGYVKEYYNPEKNPFNPDYGNISVTMTNKLNNRTFVCYRMLSFKGKKFDNQEQVKPGDIIVVYGKIQNYNNQPQLAQGGWLITSDNAESGYTPGPRVLVNETFDTSIGSFAIVNKKAASADVWTHVATTGDKQGCMFASATINDKVEEAESWLVSPTIDLTTCKKGAILTFSHNYRGDADQRDELLQVRISKDGGNTWTSLTIADDMWSSGTNARFKAATIDLTEYASTANQVAFAYKSTATTAFQWSVQNVRIGEPEEEE